MWRRFNDKAREISEATPKERDRYADFLRVAALGVVVVGHWLAPHLTVVATGVRLRLVHGMAEPLQWVTWFFQVMPIFFFVGGMVNALSWASARSGDEQSYVDWLRRRARRLLWPLVPLLVVWTVAAPLMDALGMQTAHVSRASHAMLYPIWFLAAYLCVVAAAPVAYGLHRRLGWIALVGFAAAAAIVDALVWMGIEEAGWLNFLFVWGAIHQAGFFWHDRGLPGRSLVGVGIAVVALVGLWVLVSFSPYAPTMVATGFEERPNDLPPSVALLGLAVAQFGVIAALRRPLERWLHRPWPWAVVSLGGQRLMTVYLWHMTALVVVALAVVPTEIWPLPARPDTTWWLWRIPWVVLLAAVLALLVALFGRLEQSSTSPPRVGDRWWYGPMVLVATGLVVFAIARLMLDGLYDGGGVAGLAWSSLLALALGLWGLGVFSARSSNTS